MNCFADALICATAADVLRHHFIDFSVGGICSTIEKRGSFHDHTGLAEPALRHVMANPCSLAGMFARGRKAFNCGEAFTGGGTDGYLACANGCAVFMDGASAAYADTATVLCSTEFQLVAQNPEQGSVGLGDDFSERAINMERILRHCERPC